MRGLHLTDLEALRQFSRQFSEYRNELDLFATDVVIAVTEARDWIERCGEEAERELDAASSRAEECREELDYCLSQEDEDYVPDCSGEEAALEDALYWVGVWTQRCERIKALEEKLSRNTSSLLSRMDTFKSEAGERYSSGKRYLRDQIARMEELLRSKSPGV